MAWRRNSDADILDVIAKLCSTVSWRRLRAWLRRRRDAYDPRKPEYLAPALPEDLQRLSADLLRRQIGALEGALRRRRQGPDCEALEHYAKAICELRSDLAAATAMPKVCGECLSDGAETAAPPPEDMLTEEPEESPVAQLGRARAYSEDLGDVFIPTLPPAAPLLPQTICKEELVTPFDAVLQPLGGRQGGWPRWRLRRSGGCLKR
mmetsp:Transcript_120127/g.347088  ORF Transcript_120127/g.347088 Transcript_120127/m.347088 type:complete len:207 (+) Transcript_120127:121-741(+)